MTAFTNFFSATCPDSSSLGSQEWSILNNELCTLPYKAPLDDPSARVCDTLDGGIPNPWLEVDLLTQSLLCPD